MVLSGRHVVPRRGQSPQVSLHLLHAFLIFLLLRVGKLNHKRTRATLHRLRVVHSFDGRYCVLFGRVCHERAPCRSGHTNVLLLKRVILFKIEFKKIYIPIFFKFFY